MRITRTTKWGHAGQNASANGLRDRWLRHPGFKSRSVSFAAEPHTHFRLSRCLTCAPLLELLDYSFEIGIACAKAACKPVSTALGDLCAIGENLKLTGVPWLSHSLDIEALLNEGHETRDLGVVIVSCRAVKDLDLHLSNLLCSGPLLTLPFRLIFLLSSSCTPA